MATNKAAGKQELERYIVHGVYSDELQSVSDIVDAASDEAAEAMIKHARAEEQGSGYQCEAAQKLGDYIAYLQDVQTWSAKRVATGVKNLALQYAHWRDDDADAAVDGQA